MQESNDSALLLRVFYWSPSESTGVQWSIVMLTLGGQYCQLCLYSSQDRTTVIYLWLCISSGNVARHVDTAIQIQLVANR